MIGGMDTTGGVDLADVALELANVFLEVLT